MIALQKLMLIALSIPTAYALALPNPYNETPIYPFVEGDLYFQNGKQIDHLIATHEVKTVIEVGCWLGQSSRNIAKKLPQNGKLYAVDHWKGSPQHQIGQPLWIPQMPYLYEQFLSNVIHAGLTDKIIPVRMTSLEGANFLSDVVPDLIYIDAGHETEDVYADLTAWYPYVEGHGILCGDDWQWETVRKGVEIFAAERNLTIESDFNFWRLVE